MIKNEAITRWFLLLALGMLLFTLVFGSFAAHSYTSPGIWKNSLGFIKLRPLHVSSALLWILLGSIGCIRMAVSTYKEIHLSITSSIIQASLWLFAIGGIFYSYFNNTFGGREYWEFPPVFALPIALAWLLFAIDLIKNFLPVKGWPVYMWMWMTGVTFFLFTFLESYLWQLPYFRSHFIKDMTIQWKAGGSMVGAWNQLIYGLAFFLMAKISGDKNFAHTKTIFAMYFLGLFNLMFNWSHHIYTLPTENYIRFVGYIVSMTEWILLLRIIYTWKKALQEGKKLIHKYAYWYLLAADVWVFLNLFLALCLSIPAINIYTHGTYVTVAHAMGTTIGINTMILLAAYFYWCDKTESYRSKYWLSRLFWFTQGSLLLFWIIFLITGIKRGIWQMDPSQVPFQQMMQESVGWFRLLNYVAGILLLSLGTLAIILIYRIRKLKFPSYVKHH